MKITIELSDQQVRGIKQYLIEVGGIEKPTKEDIKDQINGDVQTLLDSPSESIANYIRNS